MATQKLIFNTDVDTTAGLSLAEDKLRVKVDGTTIQFDGGGALQANFPAGISVSAISLETGTDQPTRNLGIVSIDGVPTVFKENLTSVVASTTPGIKGYDYISEGGTPYSIAATGFISPEFGNTLTVGPTGDGGLYVPPAPVADGTTIVNVGGTLTATAPFVSAVGGNSTGSPVGTITIGGTPVVFNQSVITVAPTTIPGVKGYTIVDTAGTQNFVEPSGFISYTPGNLLTIDPADGGFHASGANFVSTTAGNTLIVDPTDGRLYVPEPSAALSISTTAGNAATIDPTDGGIYVSATALLPDDQMLVGDNSGSVLITLLPSGDPAEQVNYAIRGDVKVAATTPASTENTNLLKKDPGEELYVDMQDVATALGMTLGLNTTAMKLELKRGATVVSSVDVQDFTNIGSTAGTFYMLKA